MAKPVLTEKLVYLALKDIFRGNEIQPSTIEGIRKKIEKHKDDSKIKVLIQNHGVERVSKVAKDLLEWQVFVSMAKAEVRFPEVFEAQKPTSPESNIGMSSAAAVRSAEELPGNGDGIKIRKGKERTRTNSQAQSLDSISLPLWDQHRVLVRVQYALEKTCFTFAQKHLGELLQKEGWDCAEAVELNRWPRVLLTYQEECNLISVQEVNKPLSSLLDSIAQLRHDAVHRARLSSDELSQHLNDAVMLAQLLQDDRCSEFISIVRQRTQDAIGELVRSKAFLDGKLAEIKNGFAAKRAELDRQEAASLEAAVREHVEPTISVSGSLDPLYHDLGGIDAIHAPWRHGCDPAPPCNKAPGSEGLDETPVATSAVEFAAGPAGTDIPEVADEEYKEPREVKKNIKIEKKKAKKEKKAAKKQVKVQEEEEGTHEPNGGGGPGDGAVEGIHEDVEIVKQLSAPPILVPPVDAGSIQQALTSTKNQAGKDKDEDPLEEEQYFECPEVVPDSHESDPKHPSTDAPLEQQAVRTDTPNLTSEERRKPEIAATCNPSNPNPPDYGNGSLNERTTSPAPTFLETIEHNTNHKHTKSPMEQVISVMNGHTNVEAAKDSSDYNSVLEALSQAMANKKGDEAIIPLLQAKLRLHGYN